MFSFSICRDSLFKCSFLLRAFNKHDVIYHHYHRAYAPYRGFEYIADKVQLHKLVNSKQRYCTEEYNQRYTELSAFRFEPCRDLTLCAYRRVLNFTSALYHIGISTVIKPSKLLEKSVLLCYKLNEKY